MLTGVAAVDLYIQSSLVQCSAGNMVYMEYTHHIQPYCRSSLTTTLIRTIQNAVAMHSLTVPLSDVHVLVSAISGRL